MGLSASKWAEVRRVWEQSPRRGYAWLIAECGIDVDASTISKRALKEGWKKREKTSADKTLDLFDGEKGKSAETRPKRAAATARKSMGGEKKGASKAPRKPRARKPAGAAKAEGEKPRRIRKRPFEKEGAFGASENEKDSANEWVGSHDLDTPRNPFGRPKEYKPEYAKQAFKLCLLGATDKEIADFFEVTERTINNWKQLHPEFFQALRRGKTEADAEVAASLFQRAIGLTVEKQHVVAYKGHIKIVDLVEHIVGDVGAQKMWLYNRAPDRWKAEPEPPAPALDSLYPSEAEQRDIYEKSMQATREMALKARRRREKMGMFDGSRAVPVDATVSDLRAALGDDDADGDARLEDGGDGGDWEVL